MTDFDYLRGFGCQAAGCDHPDYAEWGHHAPNCVQPEIDLALDEIDRLRGVIRDAVERMWENEIGVCYVEAGVRARLLAQIHPDSDHEWGARYFVCEHDGDDVYVQFCEVDGCRASRDQRDPRPASGEVEDLMRRELAGYQTAGQFAETMKQAIEAFEQGHPYEHAVDLIRNALYDAEG